MEAILNSKKAPGRGNRRRYLVKWVDYPDPTWEPVEYVSHLEDMLAEFNRTHPVRSN